MKTYNFGIGFENNYLQPMKCLVIWNEYTTPKDISDCFNIFVWIVDIKLTARRIYWMTLFYILILLQILLFKPLVKHIWCPRGTISSEYTQAGVTPIHKFYLTWMGEAFDIVDTDCLLHNLSCIGLIHTSEI